MKLWKFLSFLLLLAPLSAMAQIGIYGEFSSTHITAASEPQMYGITFGGYDVKSFQRHLNFLSVGPDFRLTLQSGTSSNGIYGGRPAQSLIGMLVGPRVAFKLPVARLHPYLEGLIGGGDSQIGEIYSDAYSRFHPSVFNNGANKNGGASLEGQILGGLDLQVKPRVDWRVVEFGYAQLVSTGTHGFGLETLSTGIVVRLP
ncbi:MAG: hypothetical protein ACYDC6_09265 [Acidobacteriaceae bacterium]